MKQLLIEYLASIGITAIEIQKYNSNYNILNIWYYHSGNIVGYLGVQQSDIIEYVKQQFKVY
jgi:hypothetical protein